MFCPRCGQERISEETSYCSRCGFLLTGIPGLLATGGRPTTEPQQAAQKALSPRSRGIRQGVFLFLLTIVIAPIVGIFSEFALGITPWPVGIVIFGLGFGGLLRIAYAVMFESKVPVGQDISLVDRGVELSGKEPQPVLPAQDARSEFNSSDAGSWLETNDLDPPSVTDHTTKLLEKDS